MSQSRFEIPSLRKSHGATQLIVRGEPIVLLAGEVRNSVASDKAALEAAFDKLVGFHANSVCVPISWELVEPTEGTYNFWQVDMVLQAARARGLHLVLLWFGMWKNALSSYVPEWVKTDVKRFPRAQNEPGKNTMAVSALSEQAIVADARAFAAMMAHLRTVDGTDHTVVMVQVENETGLLGSSRDHNPLAETAFAGKVPPELTGYLAVHRSDLGPELSTAWKDAGGKTSGTWTEVFGAMADEAFMAWHVARGTGRVGQAGKDVYPLPLFANAWLIWTNDRPGQYPSGGPVMRVLDIWRAAAPAIDLLAPDIYLEDFRAVCADFHSRGNALLIPEARPDERAATTGLYAIGKHDALCFSPYALEDREDTHPIGATYAAIASLMPTIMECQGTGRMTGLLQQRTKEKTEVILGNYHAKIEFTQPMSDASQPMSGGKLPAVPGGALVLAMTGDEFIIIGLGVSFEFLSQDPQRPNAEFLSVDEGAFQEGRWVQKRRWNGDESGHGRWLNLPAVMTVVKVRVHRYE